MIARPRFRGPEKNTSKLERGWSPIGESHKAGTGEGKGSIIIGGNGLHTDRKKKAALLPFWKVHIHRSRGISVYRSREGKPSP